MKVRFVLGIANQIRASGDVYTREGLEGVRQAYKAKGGKAWWEGEKLWCEMDADDNLLEKLTREIDPFSFSTRKSD